MCEVQWQLDRLTETDRQMKQTQGPQCFAFCANQINTFNKAYRYQTVIQIYGKKKKKKSHNSHNISMYKCYTILLAIKEIKKKKNPIEIGKLFFF